MSHTIILFSRPYLDKYNECYKNIITINKVPKGPLANLVRRINTPPLSQFKTLNNPCDPINACCLALSRDGLSFCNTRCNTRCNLLVVDDVPDLICYLLENDYKIDTSITKMFNQSDITFETNNANKLICFITYLG